MSRLSDLAYDIEQMWIEGYSPKTIAALLGCPTELVYDWLEQENLSKSDDVYDPYATVNS
jgi:uncharacterized protein YjcR